MRHLHKISIFIFLIVSIRVSLSQTISFEHLDVSDGLSQNGIHCVTFDDFGNLWVGTLNGLNKYNGFEFEVYKTKTSDTTSVSGNNIVGVCKAENGNVWVATESGELNLYQAAKNSFKRFEDDLFGEIYFSRTLKMAEDENGFLWLASAKGLIVFNPEKEYVRFEKFQGNINGLVKHHSKGILLYGEFGISHLYIKDNDIEKIPVLNGDVIELSSTKDSVVCLQGNEVISLTNDFSKMSRLFTIKKDNRAQSTCMLLVNDEVWIAMLNGIHIYKQIPGGFREKHISLNLSNLTSFHGRQVNNMTADSNGNVWIGTYKNGLNYYSRYKNQFKHINWDYSNDISKTVEPVRAICKLENGDVWFGFDSEGLGVIHPEGSQKYYDTYHDINNKTKKISGVRKILEDGYGNTLVGMRNNVCWFNKDAKRFDGLSKLFPEINFSGCYVINHYKNSSVVVAVNSGIYSIDIRKKEANDLYSKVRNTIRDVKIDSSENIWVATDGIGLIYIDTKSDVQVVYNEVNANITDGKIYSLELDGSDIWLGTNSGLNRFNTYTKRVEDVFLEEHGLSNNIVYSVDKDSKNNLWLSTNKGISKLDEKTKKISTFLNNYVFMDDAYFKGKDGRFYFGGYTGIIAFKPEDIKNTNELPAPLLWQFELDNVVVSKGDTISGDVILKDKLNHLEKLELNYNQNSFSFSVNATPFEIPNNYILRYKLTPWDRDWIYNKSGDLKLRYTNVQPGKYQLHIQVTDGSNNRGEAKKLSVIITPPFYKTLPFQLALLFCLVISVFLFFRIKLHQVKKRNIWLANKVDEQTKDLLSKNKEIQEIADKLHDADEAKLRFFTNVSHEFRTPLTIILGYLENLEKENSRHTRHIIKDNALRLLRLVNQLIEFRKIDLKQVSVYYSNVELVGFISNILSSFKILANKKNIELISDLGTKLWVATDADKLEKIVYNLISNAIKYTNENEQVIVRLIDEGNDFLIEVIDTGKGMTEEEQKLIFERFYRADYQSKDVGHGIGLSMVKELTDLLQGSMGLYSEKDKGTRFSLRFKKKTVSDNLQTLEVGQLSHKLIVESSEQKEVELIDIKGIQVLLVEDNHDLRAFIKKTLSDKYEVLEADNGKQALDILKKHIPDLIISDIMMPVMDGFEFCEKVKKNINTSHIPIIFLTAKSEEISKIEGFSLGIDDYIEKPFNKSLFIARVNALITNRQKLKKELNALDLRDSIDKEKFSERDVEFWNRVNETISANIGNFDFNTELLSEAMNMSRSTFYRKFKALTGENISDYIRKVRLNKAAELLAEKDLKISQVSQEVGFASVAQFRVKFKEQFGKNPSEY